MGLAEAHSTLKRVLGAIEEYVYVDEFLSDDSYRVVFAGPCREHFLGMSIEAARVAVWVDYVHPADMQAFDAAHDGAQKSGRLDVEYRLVGADGAVRWVRDRGHLRDHDGRRLLDGSILDVTEIKTVREALEEAKADAIFRTGGEEFLIILPGVRDDTALFDVAETVRDQIQTQPVRYSDEQIELTASIGAASTDASGHATESLLLAADHALYAAKRAGRNRVRLASSDAKPYNAIEPDCATLRLAEAIASLAAAGDPTDRGHATDVSLLAARVARRLEISPARILRCRLAGLLHDIGKVQLPPSLRATPESLSEDQRTLMRTHAVLGETLVAAVPDLRSLAPIVRQHHERYDGTGYPDRLAGESILIEARIIAAANTWIAMTAPHAHQPALHPSGALVELQQAAGTELDPRVVTALKSVLAHPREAGPQQSR